MIAKRRGEAKNLSMCVCKHTGARNLFLWKTIGNKLRNLSRRRRIHVGQDSDDICGFRANHQVAVHSRGPSAMSKAAHTAAALVLESIGVFRTLRRIDFPSGQ